MAAWLMPLMLMATPGGQPTVALFLLAPLAPISSFPTWGEQHGAVIAYLPGKQLSLLLPPPHQTTLALAQH